jgi:Carboxypeptidase regulatory-like domain
MRLLLATVLALLAAPPLAAQALRGRVLDAETGRPVQEAEVRVADAAGALVARARTGADGAFALRLPGGGAHRVSAGRLGYRLAEAGVLVPPRAAVEVDLLLAGAELALQPLEVTARVAGLRRLEEAGFFERERARRGRFLRREDVEREAPRRVSDLMRGFVPRQVGRTARRVPDTLNDQPVEREETCQPRVFLDGAVVPGGVRALDEMLLPEHVEGVEIYPGPSALPARFAGSASACGAFVVWSATGGR